MDTIVTEKGDIYLPGIPVSLKTLLQACSPTPLPEGVEVTPELYLSLCKCDSHRTLRSELSEALADY